MYWVCVKHKSSYNLQRPLSRTYRVSQAPQHWLQATAFCGPSQRHGCQVGLVPLDKTDGPSI